MSPPRSSNPTSTEGGESYFGFNISFIDFSRKRVPFQLQTSTEDEVSLKPQPQLQRQSWLEMRPPRASDAEPGRRLRQSPVLVLPSFNF
ncbi:hypothetical protein COCNU_scaffold029518G000010 [Cocos nucifera]|nr:hypothetical protein [Cocos nucifera]